MHLIFDCDGVLVDSEWLSCSVESELLADYGFDVPPEEIARRFIGSTFEQMFATIETEHGRPLPAEFLPRYHGSIEKVFAERLSAVPRLIDTLAAIEGERSVASNSPLARVRHSLQVAGLSAHFSPDRIFTAEMVDAPKPAPDLYLRIVAESTVPAAATVVVEDSVSGVVAAHAAGLRVLGFVGASHCQPELGTLLLDAGAARVFDDMGALASLVR